MDEHLDVPKTCARCRQVLPLREFPLRRKDGTRRYGHCRACKAAYQKQWYQRNAERHRAATAVNRAAVRRANKELVWTVKGQPCADCGRCYPPYVMDFDHVRGRKRGNIAHMKTYVPTATLQDEIDKCDVVCANCHRVRSHLRGHGRTSTGEGGDEEPPVEEVRLQ